MGGDSTMSGIAESYEDMAAANSELRMITLELMKLAASQDKSFEQVVKEFTANAFTLKRALSRIPSTQSQLKKKLRAARHHI